MNYIALIIVSSIIGYITTAGATYEYLKARWRGTDLAGTEDFACALWPFYWTYRVLIFPFQTGRLLVSRVLVKVAQLRIPKARVVR